MGLDQYLYKKTYVKNWEHMPPGMRHEITITKDGKPSDIKPERIVQIVEEVGYWRKANQIHHWFVENVMGGTDPNNGQDYYVPREMLQKLLDVGCSFGVFCQASGNVMTLEGGQKDQLLAELCHIFKDWPDASPRRLQS